MIQGRSAFACACLAACVVTSASSALAQERAPTGSNEARADALFREARASMDAQDYLTAKERFEASEKLSPATGTLLNLGLCYERLGLPANAYRVYRESAALAERGRRLDRARVANARLRALEEKIALVEVVVPRAGTSVSIDGDAVSDDRAVPLEAGRHLLRATAAGRVDWSTQVMATSGARIRIVVPELEAAASTPVAHEKVPTESHDEGRGPALPSRKVVALGVASAGVAAIGAGIVFGLRAKSTYDETSAHCNESVCDAQGVDLTNQAKTSATWATVSTGLGVAALAGGLVLYFSAPRSGPTVSAGTAFARDGARATLTTTF